jgi:hypothetical protein
LTAGTIYYWRIDTITNVPVPGTIQTGTVWSFEVFNGSALPTDFQNGYAVWVADTLTKICTDSTICTATLADYPNDPAASLYMARREYEGFQIGIVPYSGRRLDNVRVVASSLTSGANTIPVDRAVVGLLPDEAKWVPDVLLPITTNTTNFDIQTDDTHSIVVTAKTDPSTPAGTYTGTVTVQTDSGLDTVIDVEVEVNNFTLPLGAGNLRTTFALISSPVWDEGEYRQYGDFMLEHRLNPDNYDRTQLPNVSDLQHFKDLGMNSFNIMKIDSTPTSVTVVNNFLDGLSLDLRDMAWLFGYDEKGPEWYDDLQEKFAEHEAPPPEGHPDIERMTRAHISNSPWENPVGDMDLYNIDWICPAMDLYDYEIRPATASATLLTPLSDLSDSGIAKQIRASTTIMERSMRSECTTMR